MSEVKLSDVVSMELDGVPPRAIRVEFTCEDGAPLTIAMAADLAARLQPACCGFRSAAAVRRPACRNGALAEGGGSPIGSKHGAASGRPPAAEAR